MEIKILESIPNSGEFKEIYFGKNFNDSLWIDFNLSEDNHWVGCFAKQHENGMDKVLFNKNEKTCCVITGGKGYLLNIENKTIIFETEKGFIESLAQSINPDYYFLGNYYSVYVLNKNGLIKEIFPDIMVDGIYLKHQKKNKIIGKVDSLENFYEKPLDISIDIKSLEFDY